jgi:hypothetical protein
MRIAECIGNIFLHLPGVTKEGIDKYKDLKMSPSRFRLVIGLMIAAGVIIVSMAIYIFTNFNNLTLIVEIVLAAIGIILLIIIMGVMFLIMRSSIKQ